MTNRTVQVLFLGGDESQPVATFKNSLSQWRARYKARAAITLAEPSASTETAETAEPARATLKPTRFRRPSRSRNA